MARLEKNDFKELEAMASNLRRMKGMKTSLVSCVDRADPAAGVYRPTGHPHVCPSYPDRLLFFSFVASTRKSACFVLVQLAYCLHLVLLTV